jgi:hypothetical protein
MSLDTIAIFDVATPPDPLALLERLAADPALRVLVDRYGHRWTPTEWSVAPSIVDPGGADLIGPGGIVLRLGRRSVEVYHLVRFRSFAGEIEDRRALRRAFRAIARHLGSRRAIYTHELAPTERDPDAGTDVVEASLRAAVGPSATSFAELALADDYGERCWYVDTFADLDAS